MGYFVLIAFMGAYPFPPQQQLRNFLRHPAPQAVVNVKPGISLKPGQACAIPLVNALHGQWSDDNMVKHLQPAPRPSADVVPPPAPSCDDVK